MGAPSIPGYSYEHLGLWEVSAVLIFVPDQVGDGFLSKAMSYYIGGALKVT